MEKTSPLVVERSYDAPPEQIWQAITDPEQMKKWYFDLPGFRAEVGGLPRCLASVNSNDGHFFQM